MRIRLSLVKKIAITLLCFGCVERSVEVKAIRYDSPGSASGATSNSKWLLAGGQPPTMADNPATQVAAATAPTTEVAATAPTTEETAVASVPPPPDEGNNGDYEGAHALAEQFSAFGHQRIRVQGDSETTLLEVASLYRAAFRLNPQEPRFARDLADVLLALHDGPDAADILNDYLKLKPQDELSFVQLMDLHLATMQDANEQIAYLRKILSRENPPSMIPAAVRSEAAVRAAKLLASKGLNDQARKMLDSALILNHVNMSALMLKFQMLAPTALPGERMHELLAMLRANPTNSWVHFRIGQELANEGLVQLSNNEYKNAIGLVQHSGQLPDPAFGRYVGSELIVDGDDNEALGLLDQYITSNQDDLDGWFILLEDVRWVAGQDKSNDKLQAAVQQGLLQTSIAVANHLAKVRLKMGDASATVTDIKAASAPALPDFSGDPDLLKKSGDTDLAQEYISAMVSQAWYELYLQHDSADAGPVIAALAQLLPDSDPQLQRLQGWKLFVDGTDNAGALAKFNAVTGDPMADLGAVLIMLADPTKHDEGVARAAQLWSKYPSGAVGATLALEFRDLKLKIEPASESPVIASMITDFPQNILQIVATPAQFYTVHFEATRPTYEFGEPILARMTIANIGGADLSIGPDGVLHPDIWFDAYLAAQVGQTLPGAATAQITQRLMLPANQSLSMMVRLDAGPLFGIFANNPQTDLFVDFSATTNPVITQPTQANGLATAQAGSGGNRVWISKLIERHSASFQNAEARDQLTQTLNKGDGGQRLLALQSMALVAAERNVPNVDANAKSVGDDFAKRIHDSMSDPDKSVSSWAKYLDAMSAPADQQGQAFVDMSKDSRWQARMLALLATRIIAGSQATDAIKAQAADTLQRLGDDPENVVKTFAAGIAADIAHDATQPSPAQPSSAAPQPDAPQPTPVIPPVAP
jgi:hypothetical protein